MPSRLLHRVPDIVDGTLIPIPRDGNYDDGYRLVREALTKTWHNVQYAASNCVIEKFKLDFLELLIEYCENHNDIFKHIT